MLRMRSRAWTRAHLCRKRLTKCIRLAKVGYEAMQIFVSGQIHEIAKVRRAFAVLRRAGATISYDWTRTDRVADKIVQREECGRRAVHDIEGVLDADVYILLSDNRQVGKGMYAELGAALALKSSRGWPEVYVVGPLNHLSIFYLHPLVRHRASVTDVVAELELPDRQPIAA